MLLQARSLVDEGTQTEISIVDQTERWFPSSLASGANTKHGNKTRESESTDRLTVCSSVTRTYLLANAQFGLLGAHSPLQVPLFGARPHQLLASLFPKLLRLFACPNLGLLLQLTSLCHLQRASHHRHRHSVT